MFKVEQFGTVATEKAVCHACKAEERADIWTATDSLTQCVTPSGWAQKIEGYMMRLYCPSCA